MLRIKLKSLSISEKSFLDHFLFIKVQGKITFLIKAGFHRCYILFIPRVDFLMCHWKQIAAKKINLRTINDDLL